MDEDRHTRPIPRRRTLAARPTADNEAVEYLDERDLNVFIDGSSFWAPRRGGMGIVFVTEGPDGHWTEEPYEMVGFAGVTNNQMEIQACIEALQAITRGRVRVDVASYRKLVFWTDSQSRPRRNPHKIIFMTRRAADTRERSHLRTPEQEQS
jgi:hypothetical protein